MTRPTYATINQRALTHNLRVVRDMAAGCQVVAMIKADAYGHGLANVVDALREADAFGVACIEEAMTVRELAPNARIVLLEGVFEETELALLQKHKFETVVHCIEQLEMLERCHLSQPLVTWLKVNTGMQRLGVPIGQALTLWHRLANCPSSHASPYIMTHFSDADALNKTKLQQQIACFMPLRQEINAPCSMANSAAIIGSPESHADWVRPGIMLYGISPFVDRQGDEFGLQAVMEFKSTLIAIQECQAGDRVGYGEEWCCPQAMRVGVVAVGYGDGYPLRAPEGTPVLLNGQPSSIIGRVSMDMLTIDLRQHPQASLGDEVTLWGRQLPIERIAQHTHTLAYELMCRISRRVHRQILI